MNTQVTIEEADAGNEEADQRWAAWEAFDDEEECRRLLQAKMEEEAMLKRDDEDA